MLRIRKNSRFTWWIFKDKSWVSTNLQERVTFISKFTHVKMTDNFNKFLGNFERFLSFEQHNLLILSLKLTSWIAWCRFFWSTCTRNKRFCLMILNFQVISYLLSIALWLFIISQSKLLSSLSKIINFDWPIYPIDAKRSAEFIPVTKKHKLGKSNLYFVWSRQISKKV